MALCSSSEVAVSGEGSGHLGGAVATTWRAGWYCSAHSSGRTFPQVSDAPLALEEEVVGQSVRNHPSFLQTHGAEQSPGEEQIADL
eukprot:1416383-Amphidinium_carterae.1